MNFEFAADLETPVSAYLKLAPLTPVFLLESVEPSERIGRYSFIGILPRREFTLQRAEDAPTFFGALKDCLLSLPSGADSRLSAGLVGYFAYHASALLHPKMRIKESAFPFAGFVLPSAILMFDHLKRRMTLTSLLPEPEQQSLVREIRSCFRNVLSEPASGRSTEPVSTQSRGDFCRSVERAREFIAAGDIFQIVLSMQFEGETEAHPFQMYRALRMINPSPYMFYLDCGGFQFFGSSPETMIRTDGDRLTLRPIAGTRPRGSDPQADAQLEKELLSDPKERAEHLMLLDLARNDLGRISDAGSIRVPDFMKVERYSHVMHLVSTVESTATVKPPLRDLMAAVFPAGTVSGAPKVRAMQLIDELEPHSRDLYAGSVGYFGSGGEIDHCIAIRCILHSRGRYSYCAGAGIVADSVPEREHAEIAGKAMALRRMLAMVEEPL